MKALTMLALLAAAASAHAQTWFEAGDAPEALPGVHQVTMGLGPLTSITGAMDPGDSCDAYAIHIASPSLFSATLVGGAAWDTQLWLFTPAGMGVAFNDDSASTLQSTLSGAFVVMPGTYVLAVSRYDYDASSPAGPMWMDSPFGTERAPDGPGAPGPVVAWSGSAPAAYAPYTITLTGATYAVIPTPGSLALLGLGGALLVRRRR